jgi:hypothetical protein
VQIDQLITGLVAIIIGMLMIFNRKIIVQKTLHSQKQLDQSFGKHEKDYSKTRYTILPNLLVSIIGLGLIVIGTFTFLSQLI